MHKRRRGGGGVLRKKIVLLYRTDTPELVLRQIWELLVELENVHSRFTLDSPDGAEHLKYSKNSQRSK